MSATQINKLGDRLRTAPVTEVNLLQLDDYRRQFAVGSAEVLRLLRDEFHQQPTPAIRAKLQRWVEALSEAVDHIERGGRATPPPSVSMLPAGPDMPPNRDNLTQLLKALVSSIPVLRE